VGVAHTVVLGTYIGTLAHSFGTALTKNKNHPKGGFYFWQGHLCNPRTDFIRDLLSFGKEIKVFLEKLNKVE
jgi:hypothetical protein